jgi:nitroreductase
MNDGIELLMTRRSIRSYTDEPVSDQDVETVLRAAMAAPSAGNQQPWHFVVIRDRSTMARIMEVHPYSKMLSEASVCIAVLADLSLERHEGYWVQDASAATQNLLLAAHALGLGAVWLGVHPRKDRESGVRQILGLPDSVRCLSLVSIGHPAEEAGRADRYDPSRVHHETW